MEEQYTKGTKIGVNRNIKDHHNIIDKIIGETIGTRRVTEINNSRNQIMNRKINRLTKFKQMMEEAETTEIKAGGIKNIFKEKEDFRKVKTKRKETPQNLEQ